MDPLKHFRNFAKSFASEEGAQLVEFALTFPMLLLLMLGIIDFGLAFQRYQVLTNAAREGARVAVLPGYAQADVRTRVDQYLLGSSLTPSSVRMLPVTPTVVTVKPGLCMTVVPVTVEYDHAFVFMGGIGSMLGSSFGTKTLTSTARMRSETPAAACP